MCMVLRNLSCKKLKSVHRPMSTFKCSARIRIIYKLTIKVGIQYPMNCMMNQSVSYWRLMDMPRFWIADFERLIRSMLIDSLCKFFVKTEDIIHKPYWKSSNIVAFLFSYQKFLPWNKQIFYGNDTIIDMARLDSSLSLSLSQWRLDFESCQRGISDLD